MVGSDQIQKSMKGFMIDLITHDRISSPHNTQRMIPYSLNNTKMTPFTVQDCSEILYQYHIELNIKIIL